MQIVGSFTFDLVVTFHDQQKIYGEFCQIDWIEHNWKSQGKEYKYPIM